MAMEDGLHKQLWFVADAGGANYDGYRNLFVAFVPRVQFDCSSGEQTL